MGEVSITAVFNRAVTDCEHDPCHGPLATIPREYIGEVKSYGRNKIGDNNCYGFIMCLALLHKYGDVYVNYNIFDDLEKRRQKSNPALALADCKVKKGQRVGFCVDW